MLQRLLGSCPHLVVSTVFLLSAVSGCSQAHTGGATLDEDAGISDEFEAIPFASTIELDTEALAALDASEEDGTLRFEQAPEALDGVRVGSVIVGGVGPHTPFGLLRGVIAVERSGAALTLKTAQVPIQLAYRKLHLRFAREASVAELEVQTRTAARPKGLLEDSFDKTQAFNYVLFDADSDKETTNDQIMVEGELGGGFDYELSLDFDWGAIEDLPDAIFSCITDSIEGIFTGEGLGCSLDDFLPELFVDFSVYPKVYASVDVHGAAILDYSKEVDLFSATLPPVPIGPVLIVPKVDITAELAGGASAAFRAGLHGSARFRTGVRLSSKQLGQPELSELEFVGTDFGTNETSVTLRAYAKVGLGARLNLLLFGGGGPYFTARPFGKLDADLAQDPCWSLHAGIDANLGIRVSASDVPVIGDVLGLIAGLFGEDDPTLLDWQALSITPLDLELASGVCDAPPDAPMLPPGSGPDAMRFAEPTFTPWSRTYASPVEGAHAASPGNATLFTDFERTIDGHFVRAGFGVHTLVKFDRQGNLVWARELHFEERRLRPLRVASDIDASMSAVSSATTAPIVLTKLAQDGSVLGARAFDVPLELCAVDIASLESDGTGGFFVAGSCVGKQDSFLLHARERDATFWLLGADDVRTHARVLARIEGDAFVSGRVSGDTDALFAARLDRRGNVVYAKRYQGCAEAPDAIPSAALVGALGEVTLAGSGGAEHNGILMRLRPDGSVGFASFPGFGFGAGSVFLLDSVVELPTTGYVAGGSAVNLTGEAPDNVPSAALVGLDAAGRILWANRYTFGTAPDYRASGHVGVRLTDEGGVVATALLADEEPLGGKLWAFEAVAKDGSISFTGNAQVTRLPIQDLPCALTASDLPISVVAHPVSARSVLVEARAATVQSEKQTAE